VSGRRRRASRPVEGGVGHRCWRWSCAGGQRQSTREGGPVGSDLSELCGGGHARGVCVWGGGRGREWVKSVYFRRAPMNRWKK
jgi:hypothetical protein